MSSKNYEENDYKVNLDLLIIYINPVFDDLGEAGAKLELYVYLIYLKLND